MILTTKNLIIVIVIWKRYEVKVVLNFLIGFRSILYISILEAINVNGIVIKKIRYITYKN